MWEKQENTVDVLSWQPAFDWDAVENVGPQ